MADGHPSSCAHATIGSVCHCECSGVRHSTAINGGVPAPASASNGAQGTPTDGKDKPQPAGPNPTPVDPESATPDQGGSATPEPGPPQSFDDRVAAAATGDAARTSAPVSLVRGDLTEERSEALTEYGDETYRAINATLRDPDADADDIARRSYASAGQVRGWIDEIDGAMADSPLPDETVTWRGVRSADGMFGDALDGDMTGVEWDEAAYVSTTTDANMAAGFARAGNGVPGSVVMRILTPAGTGAVEISGSQAQQGFNGESELLLQRGLRMRVVTDRGADAFGTRFLDVEVVPAG